MQIKTIMKYHLTTLRMTIFKTKQNPKKKKIQKISVGQDAKKLEPFHIVGGNVIWSCGKQYGCKKLKVGLPRNPAILHLVFIQTHLN